MGIKTWRDSLPQGLEARVLNFLRVNWHLGLTAFGGPPAHFKIVSGRGEMPLAPTSLTGLL